MRDRHLYGIFPNGDVLLEDREAFRTDWMTLTDYGSFSSPACNKKDVQFSSMNTMDEAIRKATVAAGDKYDVVLYARKSPDYHSSDYFVFEPVRYIVRNKGVLGEL